MGRLRLRKSPVRFLLGGVDQVGKLDGVLNEEDRNIIADEIPVAFLCIELHCKTAHVARKVSRALVARNRRETDEGWCLFPGALQEIRLCVCGEGLVSFEEAMRAVTARMHDALGNALMVEMEDLFAEMEIINDERPARPDP